MKRFGLLIFVSIFCIKCYAFNCNSAFAVKSPPNQKVARLMNQVMKHHWSFKELTSFAKDLETQSKTSRTELNRAYDLLINAEKSSNAILKAFRLILENKDGTWLMGGIVPGSVQHQKSNQLLAEIVELYKQLSEKLKINIETFTSTKKINYRELDLLVMEIMDLSEQGHRLHK